jgi:hypothetical protein
MRRAFYNSKFLFAIIATYFIFQISSCSKDDTPAPSNASIYGLWAGTYATNGAAGVEEYFSLIFKPDGSLINDTKGNNQQHINLGIWSLTGDQITCNVTCVYGLPANLGIQEEFTATFDKATGKITKGTWKNTPPLNGSGTFQVVKVN